jgi:NAD(P)-dependent dehydrogenase (short-subunit alcohol dehydrogenase family)
MMNYATKSVLVTGATNETGFTIAKRFAKEGYAVFITSRDQERALNSARLIAEEYGVTAAGFALNMLDEASSNAVFAEVRKLGWLLDAIILNAANFGRDRDPEPLTCNIADWAEVIRTNITGNFMLARGAALQMREKGGGAIVFIGSNTSRRAIKHRSAYIASKGGVAALTRALAVDLGEYGVRVNCLLPGVIMNKRISSFPPERLAFVRARAPLKMGEIMSCADVANGAYFLASEQSGNMTGAEMVMDGGVDAQLGPDSRKYQIGR